MTATPNEQPRAVRSRTRIGSDDARAWVRKLRLGNPYAKAILMAIANYMNEDGSAYPGITTLHLDTDIAEDTIISRLRWCESIGAVALFKCWVDENGRRNHDGRGRTTSTEIRFLFDVDTETIELSAAALTKPKVLRGAALASHEARAPSPRPDGELNDKNSPRPDGELNPASPGVAPEQPPTRADRIEELDKEDSPPPPKGGNEIEDLGQEGQAASEVQPWAHVQSWTWFEAAYPEPILRQSIARQVWSALTDAEREVAIKAAKGYSIWRSKQKRPPNVLGAHLFLRERDAWPAYAVQAPAEAIPPTFITETSPENHALRVLAAIINEPPSVCRIHPDQPEAGFWRKHPVPPDLLGLAVIGDKHFDDWASAERGTHEFAAWAERIERWTGRRPEPQRVLTGGEHEFEWNGKKTMVKNFIMGLRVPTPFPPRKDGSLSGPDPPVCGE